MTTMAEMAETALKTIRAMKEDCTRHREPMSTAILCFRGEDLIAIVELLRMHGSRDMIEAARVAANGFDADLLVMHYEAWMSRSETGSVAAATLNPLTGKEWQPNDMQDLVDNHDGIAKGWITDSVAATIVNRAGDVKFVWLPFRTEGRRVIWEDVRYMSDEDGISGPATGVVPRALLRIMRQPTFGTVAPDAPMPPEAAQAIRDLLVAQFLVDPPRDDIPPCIVALQSQPGTVRDQTLKEAAPAVGIRIDKAGSQN